MATDVVVLGGGLTGISAAMHLGRPWLLLEKNERLGGHARTDEREGYYFDKTGHWLHLRDPYCQALIERLVGSQMVQVDRRARIFANGVLTRFPFQANLHGQPPQVVKECLIGFIRAWRDRPADAKPANFEEFIYQQYGEGIARHFMIPYNHKLWGVHPREITADWCTRFVPRPSMEEVVAGAVGANAAEMGYNVHFLYPRTGGIETMTRALANELPAKAHGKVLLQTAPEWIDPERRVMGVGGEEISYRAMVATIPLPRLLERMRGLPPEIERAASQLRCTPVRYLNLATKSASPIDVHWIYVPEEKYPFYRVGVYTNAVPTMSRGGGASLYVELSGREALPTGAARESLMRDCYQGLTEAQIIKSPEDVAFADLQELEFAYVVFDDNYYPATGLIRQWLEARDILPRGRYGFWTYNSMEDCILAGKEAAETLDRACITTR